MQMFNERVSSALEGLNILKKLFMYDISGLLPESDLSFSFLK